jgi:MFS family permease
MGLSPDPHMTEAARERGLRLMVLEAGFANATGAVTSGVILIAFALMLGASNAVIGVLAALPFLGQLLQGPTILLVERLRTRKRIAVISSVIGRSCLLGMAALAFVSGPLALTGMIVLQAVFCGMGAVGSCAWNAWVRDLAPEDRLGRVFGRRTLYATATNLVAGLAAAIGLDQTMEGSVGRRAAFAGLYLMGGVAGLISAGIVTGIPEPMMPKPAAVTRLAPLLAAPFRDINFRRLITFLSSWQFAINLATPFFTVFLVRQLGYSMTFVMAASAASQVANVAAVSSWGMLSDRFTNKSVLAVSAPVYILCIAAMTGASQISDRLWGMAYLILLHVIMGAAVAGVTLASTNIALKLSPKGAATAYMASSAVISSLAAGLAPILGGLFADFFAARRLELLVRWSNPNGTVVLSSYSVSHWDFYFLIAAALGVYALHRLSSVREKGEIRRREMIEQVLLESGRVVRNLSPVAGLRAMTALPMNLLRDMRLQARLARRRAGGGPQNNSPPDWLNL